MRCFNSGPTSRRFGCCANIQARRPVDSFVWRHPLISLGLWILVFGFIIDMILEVTLVLTGMYIYAQVIPFGSIFVGTPTNSPCFGNPCWSRW